MVWPQQRQKRLDSISVRAGNSANGDAIPNHRGANDAPERDPQDWQFQGSADGTNWTTLDTQTAQSFPDRFATKIYNIPNQTAYSYYRLNVTGTKGGDQGIQLAELGLYSAQTGGVHQRWIPIATPGSAYGSFFTLKNAKSGKVLASANSKSIGKALRQEAGSESQNQQWSFQAP